MNRIIPLSILLSFSILFAANDGVNLKLDYAAKQNWNYSLDYSSECVISGNGSASTKKTDIACNVTGDLAPQKDKLQLKVGDMSVKSDLYDSSVISGMIGKISKTSYDLNLIEGSPVVENDLDLSDGTPEWSIYMQLARLLPDMPQQPVKKGYTWERSASLPLQSPQGKVQCEIYRLFKVEKISPKKDIVYISWQFKYSSSESPNNSTLTSYAPVAGSGTGNAVINAAKGFIVKADMQFKTPIAQIDNVNVNWIEKAALQYEGKK